MVIRVTKSLFNISKSLKITNFLQNREIHMSRMILAKVLRYESYGEPSEVLKLVDEPVGKPGSGQIAVKWKLSPVNPADINSIQGKYPSKPKLPAIGGNEGVGEVVDVGSGVDGLMVGDRVVPDGNNLGIWCQIGIHDRDHVLKIPPTFTDVQAAMLNVNPCTAYRMLRDFEQLAPGDTVIQNGANSAVGQFVIQLCSAWNLNSVNVVRDRDDIIELKTQLKSLGATEVFTEAEIRKTMIFKEKKLSTPKLALNCVCGDSATNVLRHLGPNGSIITYGAMSREPLTIPASALIFKNIKVLGFWMSIWAKNNRNSRERFEMIEELGSLFKEGKLKVPKYKIVPIEEYQEAVTKTLQMEGKTGVKYILDLTS